MPVLHQYKGKDEFYILTAINGAIVTFQVTSEGQQRLKAGGVEPGSKFGRALLLDLYRNGEAYTHKTGIDGGAPEIDPNQLAFDFSNDPEPESLFPTCGECRSLDDLHLVELKATNGSSACILCPECRVKQAAFIDTSIPLPMASRAVINKFLVMKEIPTIHASVKRHQELLEAEFTNRWKVLAGRKKEQQGALFGSENNGQTSLL